MVSVSLTCRRSTPWNVTRNDKMSTWDKIIFFRILILVSFFIKLCLLRPQDKFLPGKTVIIFFYWCHVFRLCHKTFVSRTLAWKINLIFEWRGDKTKPKQTILSDCIWKSRFYFFIYFWANILALFVLRMMRRQDNNMLSSCLVLLSLNGFKDVSKFVKPIRIKKPQCIEPFPFFLWKSVVFYWCFWGTKTKTWDEFPTFRVADKDTCVSSWPPEKLRSAGNCQSFCWFLQ